MGGDDKKSKEKMEETRRTRKAGPHHLGCGWPPSRRDDDDREGQYGMDIGGRSTSTPAAETGTVGGDGGAEEIGSSSGGDSGGAAEEMDQDGSGGGGLSDRAHAENWLTMTRQQRKNWKQRSGRA